MHKAYFAVRKISCADSCSYIDDELTYFCQLIINHTYTYTSFDFHYVFLNYPKTGGGKILGRCQSWFGVYFKSGQGLLDSLRICAMRVSESII